MKRYTYLVIPHSSGDGSHYHIMDDLGNWLATCVMELDAELIVNMLNLGDEAMAACKSVDEHLVSTFPPYQPGQSPFEKVRAVVAKAEGQP